MSTRIKAILRLTLKKMLLPQYLIFGAIAGFTIFAVIQKHNQSQTQLEKINHFLKSFSESKDGDEVYREGLRMVGTAQDPIECHSTAQAIWKVTSEYREKGINVPHKTVVEAIQDRFWRDCK